MNSSAKRFTFDLGNSSNGPVGAVVEIVAENLEQAKARLQDALSPDTPTAIIDLLPFDGEVRFYINPNHITEAQLLEEEDV